MYTNPSIKMLTFLRVENCVCVCVYVQVCVFHLFNRLLPIWWELNLVETKLIGLIMGMEFWPRLQSVQFSRLVLSTKSLFATPWPAECQSSLSITNSQSLLKLMSIESMMPSNHLILCHPLLLLASIFPSKIDGKAYGVLSETAKSEWSFNKDYKINYILLFGLVVQSDLCLQSLFYFLRRK